MLKIKILNTGFICQGLFLIISPAKTNPGFDSFILNHLFTNCTNTHSAVEKTDTIKGFIPGSNNSKEVCFYSIPLDNPDYAYPSPIKLYPGIEKFVTRYNKENDKLFSQLKINKQQDLKIIEQVFQKYDLPLQLKYLAVVESKLISTAISGAGARGYWQLMPVTARLLGLKINEKQDERTHCYKSTVAAAKYLKELYTKFNDWLLVIAAYNGGAGSVYKAIKKSGSRDFWVLRYFLPFETRMHVKKYISTNFYFEGQGGITTMSKKESEDHLLATEKYLNPNEELKDNTYLLANEKTTNNKRIVLIRKKEEVISIEK